MLILYTSFRKRSHTIIEENNTIIIFNLDIYLILHLVSKSFVLLAIIFSLLLQDYSKK